MVRGLIKADNESERKKREEEKREKEQVGRMKSSQASAKLKKSREIGGKRKTAFSPLLDARKWHLFPPVDGTRIVGPIN